MNSLPGPYNARSGSKQRSLSSILPPSVQRAAHQTTPRSRRLLGILACLALLVWFRSTTKHAELSKGEQQDGDAKNWGDYVGRGLGRAKVLDSTPSGFNGLDPATKQPEGYAARRLLNEEPRAAAARADESEESEKRGTWGGKNPEWTSGVVGSGDRIPARGGMLKEQVLNNAGNGAGEEPPSKQRLAKHIEDTAWAYSDDKDRENSEKVLEEAKRDGTVGQLPLRDQVRESPEGRKDAADKWSDVYTAQEGERERSALESKITEMTRKYPVVVFSKSYCPHSKRAKDLLTSLHLSPPPFIVEVDLRPDSANMKSLLTRLTGHSTFPNVIIGSRSIGGADDLFALHEKNAGKDLRQLLKEVGVKSS